MILLYLPSEAELRAAIEREREMVVRERFERRGVEMNETLSRSVNITLKEIPEEYWL